MNTSQHTHKIKNNIGAFRNFMCMRCMGCWRVIVAAASSERRRFDSVVAFAVAPLVEYCTDELRWRRRLRSRHLRTAAGRGGYRSCRFQSLDHRGRGRRAGRRRSRRLLPRTSRTLFSSPLVASLSSPCFRSVVYDRTTSLLLVLIKC